MVKFLKGHDLQKLLDELNSLEGSAFIESIRTTQGEWYILYDFNQPKPKIKKKSTKTKTIKIGD